MFVLIHIYLIDNYCTYLAILRKKHLMTDLTSDA